MNRKTGIYPFWLWNGQMTRPELSRQIKLAKTGGMTGLTVHGRIGNEIPYLSPKWMDLMRFVCEEAQKAGLEIWLYDEQGFPSGDAAGKIPALGEAFQQKALLFSEIKAAQARELPDVIRVFSKKSPENMVDLSTVSDDEPVICFQRIVFPGFPDMLGRDTAKEFLKITHDQYYAALSDFFDNGVITGVFTDDNHYLFAPGPLLAYMDDLEASFQEAYNYSILDHLSALVENIPGCGRIRQDYYRHVTQVFNERFMKPMHDWCREHQVDFLGHLSGDEGPMHKMISRFGEPGCYLKYFEIPGMDDFLLMNLQCAQMRTPVNTMPAGGNLNRTSGFPVIICTKQATSAAAQIGDGRCMSEILSSSGWAVPMEMVMNHLRFLNILGVNIFVTHDFAYTSAKVAKRDHPASYFFQQPYFRRNKELFASIFNSLEWTLRGRTYAETLVIHPADSMQAFMDGAEIDEPGHYRCNEPSVFPDSGMVTQKLSELGLQLMQRHISFEFGYESMLEYASVKDGRFCIGKGEYRTVILPEIVTVSSRLAALLREFAAQGGAVIYAGCRPEMVDGIPGTAGSLPDGMLISGIDEKTPLPMKEDLNFTVINGEKRFVASAVRIVDGKFEYMLHNTSNDGDCQISVDLPGYLCADPVSEAIFPLPEKFTLEKHALIHLLPPSAATPSGTMPSVFRTGEPEIISLQDPWQVKTLSPNVYRWDSALTFYSRPAEFSHKEYDYSPEFLPFHNHFMLTYQPESLKIALETALFTSVKINGTEILDREKTVHEASPDLFCFEIADLVRPGENIYAFTRKEKHPEFIYLIGDFSVDESGEFPVLKPMEKIGFGDISRQGMPFYHGCVEYSSEFDGTSLLDADACRIEIPAPLTGIVGVRINGADLPMRPCAPWRYDIADHIRPGKNQITLIYYGTAQNFLGPRRVEQQKDHFTGWYPPRESSLYDMPQGIPAPPVIAKING